MNLYRQIPKVDKILTEETFSKYNRVLLTKAIHKEFENLRKDISTGDIKEIDYLSLIKKIDLRYKQMLTPSLKPLINATGIIIHTNLGRATISEDIFKDALKIATNYSNLEYNLKSGSRGDRYSHISMALREFLGCEDVLIVNNNASAVFLILNTFAMDKEVVVSRGELVEIGGNFRIPDVMRASGAKLVEVGTTNKTRVSDYEIAINRDTSMLMKVHKSNYSIEGFSSEVGVEEIVSLAKSRGLIDYYDLGSAYLPKLPWGLDSLESSLFDILKDAPSLLSFSGDKLFGSVQAGIIIGKKELIKELKSNQILRMFRVDKITLSILESTIIAYRKREYEKIPVLKMLFEEQNTLESRARMLKDTLPISSKILNSKTYVGGGTMPNREIPTIVLALDGDSKELEIAFRKRGVIGRIEDRHFILDMRTIKEKELRIIEKVARDIIKSRNS